MQINWKILWQYEVDHPIESPLTVTSSSIGYAYKNFSDKLKSKHAIRSSSRSKAYFL